MRVAGERSDMAPQIAERIRRPAPEGCGVISGSLPVVAFGRPETARVATVALNPSRIEFLDDDGTWLLGDTRRLESLTSLGLRGADQLTEADVLRVKRGCDAYFEGNWYRKWFHWLEGLLTSTGTGSYLNGTACHLDLVQWATDPVQSGLRPAAWSRLVAGDRDFLSWQLTTYRFDVVLLNGASAVRELGDAGLVPDLEEETLATHTGPRNTLRVFSGSAGETLFLGWNKQLAGPIAGETRGALVSWVRQRAAGRISRAGHLVP